MSQGEESAVYIYLGFTLMALTLLRACGMSRDVLPIFASPGWDISFAPSCFRYWPRIHAEPPY